MSAAPAQATITESFGRHYTAVLDDARMLQARPRGKKSECAVGDRVALTVTGADEAVIESIAPRRNALMRADAFKSREFAANVDVLAYVVAPNPPASVELMLRALTAARAAGIETWVLVNKSDMVAEHAQLAQQIARHAPSIDRAFAIAAKAGTGMDELAAALAGKRAVLAGQSGMGKSRIINALAPDAAQRIGDVSVALSSGKHTTTAVRMLALPNGAELIDSPGFQAFGLAHLSATEIERGFPEFESFAPNCKFYNCKHLDEPACAVRAAVDAGSIDAERYKIFRTLMLERVA
ncbi:MAG: ribosome small subunit-dependent GTPase A [Burkholderiaceae bacterium]